MKDLLYDPNNIFAKIIRGEIPCKKLDECPHTLTFFDINPQAPVHILLIPKKSIAKLTGSTVEDQAILGHLMVIAANIARDKGLDDNFRVVINNGAGANQTVFHLHLHLLGGRNFSWPPG